MQLWYINRNMWNSLWTVQYPADSNADVQEFSRWRTDKMCISNEMNATHAQAAGLTKRLIIGPTAFVRDATLLARFLILSVGCITATPKGSSRRQPPGVRWEVSLCFPSLSFPLPWYNHKQTWLLAAPMVLLVKCMVCYWYKQTYCPVNYKLVRAFHSYVKYVIDT